MTTTSVVASATSATSDRCGCRRGGGPTGLDRRTRAVAGAVTGTLVDVVASPLAGPAALDARRLPAGFGDPVEAVSSAIYACLGANIRSTQFSAGASVSVPPANTPVPPAGSTNLPFWSYVALATGASAGSGGAPGAGGAAGGWPGSGNGSPAGGGGGVLPYGGTT